MLGIPFLEKAIRWLRPHSIDDPVDRLNYLVTTTILLVLGLMVSAKQYVGSPIQCLTPLEFPSAWEQYAEDYCFVQDTYYVAFHQGIPENDDRHQSAIGYYQWVPIVLVLQALMFYLPNWFWKSLNKRCGIDIAGAVTEAHKISSLSVAERAVAAVKLADNLAESTDFWGGLRAQNSRLFCLRMPKLHGSFVSFFYLSIKIVYIINLGLQLYLLDRFIGSGDLYWGINMLENWYQGRDWQESGMFPRVTLCDVPIRKIANIVRYTLQCVLMINTFNEKIYLFLWCWFVLVLLATIISTIFCFFQMICGCSRERDTQKWLADIFKHQPMGKDDKKKITRFVAALKMDGILALRFMEGHAGLTVTKDIVVSLYTQFLEQEQAIYRQISTPNDALKIVDVNKDHMAALEMVLVEKCKAKTESSSSSGSGSSSTSF